VLARGRSTARSNPARRMISEQALDHVHESSNAPAGACVLRAARLAAVGLTARKALGSRRGRADRGGLDLQNRRGKARHPQSPYRRGNPQRTRPARPRPGPRHHRRPARPRHRQDRPHPQPHPDVAGRWTGAPLDTMRGMFVGCGWWSTGPKLNVSAAGCQRTNARLSTTLSPSCRPSGRPSATHSSAVQGTPGLRELRPRGGRSPWRGLYRQVGERFVIAAIAPEAQHDPRRFKRACTAASRRLDELEDEDRCEHPS